MTLLPSWGLPLVAPSHPATQSLPRWKQQTGEPDGVSRRTISESDVVRRVRGLTATGSPGDIDGML
ncbi:MAG: hypothetical protein U0929_00900 [Planctomycetaceae bacterium]